MLCMQIITLLLDTQHSNSTSIKIKQCRSNNKKNTEYTSLKVYYSKVMIYIHSIATVQVCNIPSDLCTLCFSCYYFYIVLSLYLYCRYAVYPDHHFTVIYLQTCVHCVGLVVTSTLFYLYTCTVAMLCIQIITLL
jgi:hypothetical protein